MLPAEVQEKGSLDVALANGIAPVNFPGDTAEDVRGLTPDLVSALEQIMGVAFDTTVFPNTASQLLALDSGQIDLTVSTNADSAEREKSYTFVDYIRADNSIVVAKGNPLGIEKAQDVCGMTYGEVKGSYSIFSTFETVCADAGLEVPTLSSFDDAPSMMLALISRRIDAYAGSDFNTVYQKSQGVPVDDVPLPEAGFFLLGMTVAKDNTAIAEAVAAAMTVMVESGYYQEALDHWGIGSSAIEPGINLVTK
nr:transporter substrate-binding domain-containing protein [Salipiger pentaromativorans]